MLNIPSPLCLTLWSPRSVVSAESWAELDDGDLAIVHALGEQLQQSVGTAGGAAIALHTMRCVGRIVSVDAARAVVVAHFLEPVIESIKTTSPTRL